MGDDGNPVGARKGWYGRRNLYVRCVHDSRQYMHCVFGSVGCSTRTFDGLVDAQVVTQVEQLQPEACGQQTQHRYLGESRDHGLHLRMLRADSSTLNPGKYVGGVY